MIGEVALFSGPANLWRSVEPIGGTLTLTRSRLTFKPHTFLIRGGEVSVRLDEIARVELGNSLWVIPNQLVVLTRSGAVHKLVMHNRDEWAARLGRHLSTPRPRARLRSP